jgi:hypothetical protein
MPRNPHSHRSDVAPTLPVFDVATLSPAFTRLVDDTLAQVEACPAKPEPTFEGYESLLAAIRSATTLEGTLIERGIELVAAANPDLVLVPLERPLPVHEVAKGMFRRNDWKRAGELRLDSRFVTREFYRPDLLLVDGSRQLALILDVKRSVGSCKPRALTELRARMMASALVVRDVLERDHDAPPVARADIAIIDAAGDCRDEARGILALDDLDWLLGIAGAGAAIRQLRALFGERVRRLLDERCAAIVRSRIGSVSAAAGRTDAEPEDADDLGSYDGEVDADEEPVAHHGLRETPSRPARVAVGIASRSIQ